MSVFESPSASRASMSPEAFQEEVVRRADSFSIKFHSLHLFSRIVYLLASLSLVPFFLAVLLVVLGFAFIFIIALTSN